MPTVQNPTILPATRKWLHRVASDLPGLHVWTACMCYACHAVLCTCGMFVKRITFISACLDYHLYFRPTVRSSGCTLYHCWNGVQQPNIGILVPSWQLSIELASNNTAGTTKAFVIMQPTPFRYLLLDYTHPPLSSNMDLSVSHSSRRVRMPLPRRAWHSEWHHRRPRQLLDAGVDFSYQGAAQSSWLRLPRSA